MHLVQQELEAMQHLRTLFNENLQLKESSESPPADPPASPRITSKSSAAPANRPRRLTSSQSFKQKTIPADTKPTRPAKRTTAAANEKSNIHQQQPQQSSSSNQQLSSMSIASAYARAGKKVKPEVNTDDTIISNSTAENSGFFSY
jgi:transposase